MRLIAMTGIAVAARFATQGFYAFFDDDRNHH
jgi:hypothetical protein